MRTIKKWVKIDKHVNYSDKIFRSIVKTSYAKKKLSSLLSMVITVIVRIFLDFLLAFIFNFNYIYLDFFIQIFISIMLVVMSERIYFVIERFSTDIYALTKYLVNNYTNENYRKWKRRITLILCLASIVFLYCFEINSNKLIISILQYLVCYVIIDMIENNYASFMSPYVGPSNRPQYTFDDDFKLVEDSPKNGNVTQLNNTTTENITLEPIFRSCLDPTFDNDLLGLKPSKNESPKPTHDDDDDDDEFIIKDQGFVVNEPVIVDQPKPNNYTYDDQDIIPIISKEPKLIF